MKKFVAKVGTRSAFFVALVTALVPAGAAFCQTPGAKTQYLVEATGGPGFASPGETMTVLEKGILPGFDYLLKLQADKKFWPAACRSATAPLCLSSRLPRMTRPTGWCAAFPSGASCNGR